MADITKEALIAAIYGQESSSGKADTSKANYAGAIGPMQVTAPTFQGMKDKGIIPRNLDFNKPEDTKAAGEALVRHLFDKYDGDAGKVAAAYYSGEKAVRADGTIADFRDRKNAKAPTTLQYRDQVLARLGAASVPSAEGAQAVTVGATAARADVRDFYAQMPERGPKGSAKAAQIANPAITGPNLVDSSGVTPLVDQYAASTAALRGEQERVDAISFPDKAKLAFIENTFAGALIRKATMNEFLEGQTPAPGFQVDPKYLADHTEDEQAFLQTAVNPQHLARIQTEIEWHRKDMADINASGVGVGIAASLFAGLPEGYLSGFGAAKALQMARLGSLALAEKGRRAAALGSSAVENIGVNLATTAAQDQIDPYVSGSDYAMAVGMGGLGVALGASGVFAAAGKAEARGAMNALIEGSAREQFALREQAVKNVGTDAGPQALQAEVRRLEGDRIKRTLAEAQGRVDSSRRLLPDDEALRPDSPEVKEPAVEDTTQKVGPTASPVSFPERVDNVLKAFGVEVESGDRSAAGGTAGARKITIKDMPEAEFMAAHGNSVEDVKAHEFAHTFWQGATALPNFKDPKNKALKAELLQASREFRPFVWENHKGHAAKADELLADGLAYWMKHPERRGEFPEIDKMVTAYDAGTLQKHFPAEERATAGATKTQEDTDAALRIDRAATDEALKSAKTPEERAAAVRYLDEKPVWDKFSSLLDEKRVESMSGKYAAQVAEVEGTRFSWLNRQQEAGVRVLPELEGTPRLKVVGETLDMLQKKYLPDSKIAVGIATHEASGAPGVKPTYEAIVYSAGKNHVIGLRDNLSAHQATVSAVHEFGHALFHESAREIPPRLLARMVKEHDDFLKALRSGKDAEARARRFSEGSAPALREDKLANTSYTTSFDEYTAEAFVRYVQKGAREGTEALPQQALNLFAQAWEKIKDLYNTLMGRGILSKDEAFSEFFDRVAKGTLANADRDASLLDVKGPTEYLAEGLTLPDIGSMSRNPGAAAGIVSDPKAREHGLENIPVKTVTEQAEAKAVLSLYKKADEAGGYKPDEKRLSKLLSTAAFEGAQGTANVMARSDNPVVRMVAAELLESTSGVAGRRANAAISKHLNEQAYLGNTLNEFQSLYKQFRNSQGGTVVGDFFDGKTWQQFNRMVAEHIESLRPGAAPVSSPPAVMEAAAKLQAAYERIAGAQKAAKTVGWASLPETSQGYMPHRMSPEKFRQITPEQENILHKALVDQFIDIEGFDISFSQNLASKYIDRIRRRALGGYEAPVGIHQVGAADVVEDALKQMNLGREEITAMMKKYMAGGAGHTKRRLQLDLSQEHMAEDGTSFKLMDLFETDQFKLLRGQAQRVSGEVALAEHGIMGKAGLNLLRRAMEFGGAGEKVKATEIEAFDQVAAEFLGDAYGTQSKLVDRALQANSIARLGGMGFTQFAENINGLFHVGALRTLDSITSMPRLRAEIKALARGEKVDNPIIGSLEQYRGAEFGTESYKTVFPFDNQSLEYHTYGKDTVNAADRLLRGGSFLQGKLSMWRTIHSTQQRGFAEQIVRKAAQYLKDGTNDVALRDMGITDDLMTRLRADLPEIAQFEGSRLTNFDITKARDLQAAEEFTQAIHRGVSQIIQGTFIGERGHWAHDGLMRVMTQFRTFSLTSIEKQWARQVGNVGTAKALGMVLGSMSLAAPIYMARTYLASIGRPDQEAYLERQLTPTQIARASLNYIAASGLAGDLMDATTALTGSGELTGGRTGAASNFVGNVVAPATGLVDDVWRGLQNTKEGTDPHDLLKAMPFSRLPWLIPAINALGHE